MSRTTTFLGNFHDDTAYYLQATTLYRVAKCKNIIAGLDENDPRRPLNKSKQYGDKREIEKTGNNARYNKKIGCCN